MRLLILHNGYDIIISYESPDAPPDEACSPDNTSAPVEEFYLGDDGYRPSSRHRIVIKQGDTIIGSRVLLAGGGGTGVHPNSAFAHDNIIFAAIGDFICALQLPGLKLLWSTRADPATCFGVYHSPAYRSVISHGELEIARVSFSGQMIWSAGGKDIFSEGFELHEHYAEAIDFNGIRYQFEIATGHSKIVPS